MPRRLVQAASLLAASALFGPVAHADETADGGKEACFSAYEGAQRLRKKRALIAARRELIACGGASCPSALRTDCVTWLAEVDQALPTVVFSVRGGGVELPGARVLVDGALLEGAVTGTAVPLDPGEHTLRVEADGHEPLEQKLVAREGEKARAVGVDLRPLATDESDPGISVPVIALAAVGALGLASFGFFAVKSHSAKSDLESCKGHCAEDEVDAVRRDQIIADVSLGVGLVALGVAAYLHFGTRPSETRSESAWSIGIAPRPGGGAATLGRAW